MSRLAWVTGDRQIAIAAADGSGANLLTAGIAQQFGAWGQLARPQAQWSWPTWSPDGKWVAAFMVEGADEESSPVRVQVLGVDGVHQELWWEAGGVAPIYLQWQPQGEALAALVQRSGELNLLAIRRSEMGRARLVEEGVPVFFSWTPEGGRLLVHAGDRGVARGRLVLRDPFGTAEDVIYDRPPGSFCAPVFVGGSALWATPEDGGSLIYASTPDGRRARPIINRKGLCALIAAPGGSSLLAVANAPGGEGTPYAGIDLCDLVSQEVRPLTRMPCLAFFWSPTGEWLLVAEVCSDDNCLRWWKMAINGDAPVPLGTFWPTRDVIFFLHFFDQYTMSHPLVSHDGRHIVFAGYPAGGGHADLSRPPRIYLCDVDRPEEPATEVDGGSFAVFSHG